MVHLGETVSGTCREMNNMVAWIDRTSFPGVSVYYSGRIPCIFFTFVS